MSLRPRLAAALLAPLLPLAAAGAAQAAKGPCPAMLPPGIHCGEPDASLAPAGAYHLDPSHTAVIARVSHIGYGYSIFRFDKVKADLVWDLDAPAKSSLTAVAPSLKSPRVSARAFMRSSKAALSSSPCRPCASNSASSAATNSASASRRSSTSTQCRKRDRL